MGKKAVIIVELVEESEGVPNSEVAEEMLQWFKEELMTVPWVKTVVGIEVKDF